MQHLGDQAGVAPDQVEESPTTGAVGKLFRIGVGSLQDGQLLELQPPLLEPFLRMSDRTFGALARRGRRHDECGSGAGSLREDFVLLLVAGVELVASGQGEHSSHAPTVITCLNQPFACA